VTTHLCKTCETSVEVARVDVTTVTSGPRFMWGMHERCTCCGSTDRPLEVMGPNDERLGRGQWEDA
jgi:hypothetical protein